jgi:DNA-directed RNA polymerase specialized sigma subunit
MDINKAIMESQVSNISDIDLIYSIRLNQDDEALRELIDRHSGVYIDQINKYYKPDIEGFDKQDLIEEKINVIYNAALDFDNTKNTKFSTYVGNLAKWRCWNAQGRGVRFYHFPLSVLENQNSSNRDDWSHQSPLSPPVFSGPTPELNHENNEISKIESKEELKKIFNYVNNHPDNRVKTIFKMRYCSNNKLTPWKKIAKKLDLSIQGSINIHNRIINELKKHVI